MNLEIVNFEQAKKLMEFGFPQDTTYFITKHNNIYRPIDVYMGGYAAPYLELVAKWLREKQNISLEPYRTACGWICMIVDIPSGTDKMHIGLNNEGDDKSSGQFTTFEKALSAGIDYALSQISLN